MSDGGGVHSPKEGEGEGRWVLLQPFEGPWSDDDETPTSSSRWPSTARGTR